MILYNDPTALNTFAKRRKIDAVKKIPVAISRVNSKNTYCSPKLVLDRLSFTDLTCLHCTLQERSSHDSCINFPLAKKFFDFCDNPWLATTEQCGNITDFGPKAYNVYTQKMNLVKIG